MRRTVVVMLVVAALVVGLVGCGSKDNPNVRVVSDPKPKADVKITCWNCGQTFSLNKAQPVQGNHALVVCPHCGKPTPRVVAAR